MFSSFGLLHLTLLFNIICPQSIWGYKSQRKKKKPLKYEYQPFPQTDTFITEHFESISVPGTVTRASSELIFRTTR